MSLQSSSGKNRTAVLHRPSGGLLLPSSAFTFTLPAFLDWRSPPLSVPVGNVELHTSNSLLWEKQGVFGCLRLAMSIV